MARPRRLNVRKHLEHVQLVLDGYLKLGDVPVVKDEARKAALINKSILKKHYEKVQKGNRHDIRINVKDSII